MTRLGRQWPEMMPVQRWIGLSLALTLGLCLFGHVTDRALGATTEQIVADRNTGLAIYGFDPVAYFTDAAASPGSEELELNHGGVTWRFRNEGNRAAFENDPDVYAPQFGGHDPVAVAQGLARDGHPEFFAIHDQRLFLFYSAEAKQVFDADPDGMALQAEANWPDVSKTLAP